MSDKVCNILMLGGAKRVSIGRMFLRATASAGFSGRLFSYELSEVVPIAEIAEVIVGKRWDSLDIMTDLQRVVEQHNINIVVPFVDGAIAPASRLRELCPQVFVPACPPEMADVLYDKIHADELFRHLCVPVPGAADTGFPLIAKPRLGSASKGIMVIRNRAALDRLNDSENYLLQEYIEDRTEYTVDCYVSQSMTTLAVVPRKRLEVLGGEVVKTVTVGDPALIDVSRMVIERLQLRGAITLQFLHDREDGRLMLMEINPRLGGGCVCAVQAGADIPLLIVKEWAGQPLEPPAWQSGVLIARYFQEVVFKTDDRGRIL